MKILIMGLPGSGKTYFFVKVLLATGPLTQATGPLRSDAGVGIGMLRGNPVLSAN